MAFCISVQVFSFLQHQAVFRRTQFLRHRIVVYRVYRQPLAGQVQPQYALFLSVLWSLYSLLYRQICSFVFIWYILLQNNPKSGYNVSMNLAADFFKKESRSPRGFLPRPLLRAGESVAPPPLPQKNSGGAYHFRFRFLDLCIRFGKIISKACPVGNLFSFGVCDGFNSGAKKLDTNSFFEDERVQKMSSYLVSWLRTLNEIRTFFSENPNAEFWKTFKLGRAKGKGVGGKEFLPALAFPPPPNFVPAKLACRHLFFYF